MDLSGPRLDAHLLLRRRYQHSVAYHETHGSSAFSCSKSANVLAGQGTTLCYTHQNISELWNVMTRSGGEQWLWTDRAEADHEVRTIEAGMTLLADSALVYEHWRRLVVQYGISGVRVHDARLAAAMYVHGVPHILTFNVDDFGRFAGLSPLHPGNL